VAAAVVCTWVFVGSAARADGGGTWRAVAGGAALAAVSGAVVGVVLLVAHVVGLWL
jgi:hypothetical protein